jgi:FecR protein
MPLRLAFAIPFVLLGSSSIARAQVSEADQAAPPAYVARAESGATLERDGRADPSPLNMPLLSGDRLRTAEGRMEVRFADGSALFLDARTTVDVQSDDLVRLIEGRVRVDIARGFDAATGRSGRAIAYRVDSPAGSVRITQPGEYRIALLHDADETQLELAVARGAADIFTDRGETPVRAGERAYASQGLAPSYPYAYNSAAIDAFDRWSEQPRDVRLGVSQQYLPDEMRPYASTFDDYGDWQYQQAYGYVWYPRVAAGWRPYYYGRWVSYPRYGWTWVGVDRFAWPTHHYGRWGFSAGVWFWIPQSRWAPAYVSWAYAPGYVSWCPLGWDNRPLISIGAFSTRARYSPSWTVVSASSFGRGFVQERAINWDRLDAARRQAFQLRASAPIASDVAVARGSAPVRWAGARSLPNSAGRDSAAGRRSAAPATGNRPPRDPIARSTGTPRYVNRGDAIVRSQTARPVPPSSTAASPIRTAPQDAARSVPDRQRTVPNSPAGPEFAGRAMDRQPIVLSPTPRVARPQSMDPDGAYAPRAVAPRTAEPAHIHEAPRAAPPAARQGPERAAPAGRAAPPPATRAEGQEAARPRDGGQASSASVPRRGRGGI